MLLIVTLAIPLAKIAIASMRGMSVPPAQVSSMLATPLLGALLLLSLIVFVPGISGSQKFSPVLAITLPLLYMLLLVLILILGPGSEVRLVMPRPREMGISFWSNGFNLGLVFMALVAVMGLAVKHDRRRRT